MTDGRPTPDGSTKDKRSDFSWRSFLTDAGITDPYVDQYADMLTRAHLDEKGLTDLNPERLSTIGISRVGHQMRILRKAKASSSRSGNPRTRGPMGLRGKPQLHPSFKAFRQQRKQPSLTSHLLTRSLMLVLPSWGESETQQMLSRRNGGQPFGMGRSPSATLKVKRADQPSKPSIPRSHTTNTASTTSKSSSNTTNTYPFGGLWNSSGIM